MIEIDKGFNEYAPYSSKCTYCKYFDATNLSCLAFPDGIPVKYLSGKYDHLNIVKNQVGEYFFTLENS